MASCAATWPSTPSEHRHDLAWTPICGCARRPSLGMSPTWHPKNAPPGSRPHPMAMRPCRRKSNGCRSGEHTSELQSLMRNSYDVFCLKKKTDDLQNLNGIKPKGIALHYNRTLTTTPSREQTPRDERTK